MVYKDEYDGPNEIDTDIGLCQYKDSVLPA